MPSTPGTSGTPAARISAFARALSPIRSITSAGGPMKTRSFSSQARDEVGVLGEEAVAGMHRLAAGRLGGGDDRGDAEVALADGRRADPHGAVCELDVQRLGVGRRVDRDGFDAELVEGTDYADGDLAAIRNEDALEHRARV